MATSHTSTGATYSNLTRRELEQLRKADFFAGGKALTVGDESNAGSVNDERFYTGPSVFMDDVWAIRPPTTPVPFILSSTQPSSFAAESVRWYGPQFITSGNTGKAIGALEWQDSSVDTDFSMVQSGDILLIKSRMSGTDGNANATGVVSNPSSTGGSWPIWSLELSSVIAPNNYPTNELNTDDETFSYAVVRQNAVQLFAVPGSGPLGREQTFLAVSPDSLLHTVSAPSLDQINVDRITDLVPPSFSGGEAIDRADAIFQPPAGPGSSLDLVGYRPILYRSLPDGSGPDWNSPLPKNPRIDGSIPDADQRMTIDYKAGVFRFSTPPLSGNDVKPTGGTGGVNATTGRLQLWAVYWAADKTITKGSSSSVYASRSDLNSYKTPARVYLDPPTGANNYTRDLIRLGITSQGNDFVVRALEAEESGWSKSPYHDVNKKIDFGGLNYNLWGGGVDAFRGFRIRDDGKIRMIQTFASRYPLAETRIEEKTKITVGGYTHASGDYNTNHPYSFTPTGLNLATGTIQNALDEAFTQGQYPVVHLRRGVYRNDSGALYIPPGVTLEGDGYGTILSLDGSLVKIGPNTKWGTYDPTAVKYGNNITITPALFDLPETFKIEGYTIVWNRSRRVWAIFIADSTTNAIWFNELRPDGTRVLPGLGINVKNSTGNLFTLTSPNSTNLTSGHYPRAVHNWVQDEYLFVWTEEYNGSSGVGPRSYFEGIKFNSSSAGSPIQEWYYFKFGSPRPINPSGYQYTSHPSITVSPSSGSDYDVAVGCWGYNDFALNTTAALQIFYAGWSGTIYTYGTADYAAGTVISSTDVVCTLRKTDTEAGNFIWGWSSRIHSPITGTTGYFSGGGYLSDSAHANWITDGVREGDRFLLLHQTSGADNYKGRTGWVRSVGGSAIYPQFEGAEGDQAEMFNSGSSIRYAIFPVSRIYCRAGVSRYTLGTPVKVAGPDVNATSTRYHYQEREPDFVRMSSASEDRTIIVYQNFDTRAAASRAWIPNFDNGKDLAYLDNGGIPGKSPYPVRVHLSTSYVIVSHNNLQESSSGDSTYQAVVAPSMTQGYESSEQNISEFRRSNDLELIRRSLGSRDPMDIYPNTQGNANHPYDDVSLRNYSMPIKNGIVPSFIPAVTWNGSDWVIVSPTVDLIRSDTGTLFVQSGTTQYLSDATFLFSSDSGDPKGRTYRRTLSVGDRLYFPGYGGVYRTVTSVHSEHVVALDSFIGAGTFANNVEWVLDRSLNSAPQHQQAGAKCPGFRVGLDGKVIVSSSYTTFADEVDPLSAERPKQEVLSRGLFGNTVFHKLQARVVANTNVLNTTGLTLNNIDGVTVLNPGDKVLLTAQTGGVANGLWVAGDQYWTRAPEMATDAHVSGTDIYISEGSNYGNTTWQVTNSSPTDVVDTHPMGISNLGSGDKNTYLDSKYGMKGMVWNDLVEGSRLEADLGFRGVVVGAPRKNGSGILHPTETSHVDIAWGDNMYGFLDRERIDGQSVKVRAFRQSFGPYNSEIKNITLKSEMDTGNLVLKSYHHVYTRHGGSGCPNPFFATDGYRNVFLHIGVWSYGHSWGDNSALNPPELTNRDPRTAAGYNTSLCAVFTDITGKYSIRKRVITFPNISRLQQGAMYDGNETDYKSGLPEWQRNYLIGSLPQDILTARYPGGKIKPSYGARAIWTGNTFLGLMVVPRGLLLFNLGSGEEDEVLDESVVGGCVVRNSTTYKMLELPKIKAFAYIGNGGGSPPGPKTNLERFYNDCVGDTRSLEIVDVVEVDTCWAEGTLAVVWLAGVNTSTLRDKYGSTSNASTIAEMGSPVLGITLFRSGQGGTLAFDRGRDNASFNATSYIIDVSAIRQSDYLRGPNGTMVDPKITWNGSGFTVTYLYKSEDPGVSTVMEMKSFSFPKEGLQSNFQILMAHGPANRESPRNYFDDSTIGGINSGNGMFQSKVPLRAGDIVVISRVGQYVFTGSEPLNQMNNNDTSFTNLAGAYTVLHYDSATGEANLGVDLRSHGTPQSSSVYGMILSGDGVSPSTKDDAASDLVVSSGTVREGAILKTAYDTPGIFYSAALSDIWGTFYVESQEKFVVFYSRGPRMGVTAYTRDGLRTAEVKLSSGFNPDSFSFFSVGWNGTYFLVIGSNGGYAYYWAVSPDLGIMSKGYLIPDVSYLVGTSRSQVPGPGYGAPSNSYLPNYYLRGTSVVWNQKLCQWQVGVSVGWWEEATDRAKYGSLELAHKSPQTISSYTGRTLSLSGATTYRQPGIRILATRYDFISSSTSTATLVATAPPGPGSPGQHSMTVGPSMLIDTQNSSTTLAAPISSSDTSATVVDASLLPNNNYFARLGYSELVYVTGGTGNTISLERGRYGTVATSHGSGSLVALEPLFTGNQGYLGGTTFASLPSSFGGSKKGDLFTFPGVDTADTAMAHLASDGYRFYWAGHGAIDYVNLDGAIYPLDFLDKASYPGAAGIIIQRVSKDFIFHTLSSPSSSSIYVSTDTSELTNLPSSYASYVLYSIPREDVFLFTIGDFYPLVEIQDADGVNIENVQFQGGNSDVSESYPRMSRPFWKTGGVAYGMTYVAISGAKMGQKPHVAPVTPTPLGKVEVLRFTNVKSKSRGRYGYNPTEAATTKGKKGA